MKETKEFDLFISHASEDKDSFVRPLVEKLQKFDLTIWYDELSLEIGDSLSRSIDKGLANSKYGLVVISPQFLKKNWPEYELRGLVTREIDGEKIILPIWHEITRKDLLKFSPSLADKVAIISSDHSLDSIALSIVKVARPDIFQNLKRRIEWKQLIQNAERKIVEAEEIDIGNIKHESLPDSQLLRIKIIQLILGDVLSYTLEESIDLFKRDLHPEDEIQIWEKIAASFFIITSEKELQLNERREVFAFYLGLTSAPLEIVIERSLNTFDMVEIKRMIKVFENIIP